MSLPISFSLGNSCRQLQLMVINDNVQRAGTVRNVTCGSTQSAKTFSGLFATCGGLLGDPGPIKINEVLPNVILSASVDSCRNAAVPTKYKVSL